MSVPAAAIEEDLYQFTGHTVSPTGSHAHRQSRVRGSSRSSVHPAAESRRTQLLKDATSVSISTSLLVNAETSFGATISGKILASRGFQMFDNLVIVASTLCIGIEQTKRINGEDTAWVHALEQIFIFIFILELSMRFLRSRSLAFRDGWFVFDVVVVSTAALSDWIQFIHFACVDEHHSYVNMRIILVARVARLARMARAVRLVHGFQQLWMLVSAFLNSVKTIAWVLILLLIMVYVFSTIAVEVITLRYEGNDDLPEPVRAITDNYFPTVGMTMLTMLQLICLDSLGAIYRPMVEYDWLLAAFFVIAILILAVFLMNIISAVIVTKALEQMSQDKELQKMQQNLEKDEQMRTLRLMFERLDADGSGCIDLDEIDGIEGEDAALLSSFVGDMDPTEIFGMLDIDGAGTLTIDEFCEGLYEVAVSDVPIGIKRMERQMDRIGDLWEMLKEVYTEICGSKASFKATLGRSPSEGRKKPAEAQRKGSANRASIPCNGPQPVAPIASTMPGELPAVATGIEATVTPSWATSSVATKTPTQPALRASPRCSPSEVLQKHGAILESSLADGWARRELQALRRVSTALSELETIWISANVDAVQDIIFSNAVGFASTKPSFVGSVCAAPPPVPFGKKTLPDAPRQGLAAGAAASSVSQVDKEVPPSPVKVLNIAAPKAPGPAARACLAITGGSPQFAPPNRSGVE